MTTAHSRGGRSSHRYRADRGDRPCRAVARCGLAGSS